MRWPGGLAATVFSTVARGRARPGSPGRRLFLLVADLAPDPGQIVGEHAPAHRDPAAQQSFGPDQLNGFEQSQRDIPKQHPVDRKMDVGLQAGRIDQADRKVFGCLQTQLGTSENNAKSVLALRCLKDAPLSRPSKAK